MKARSGGWPRSQPAVIARRARADAIQAVSAEKIQDCFASLALTMWRQYASSLAASSPAKAGDPVFQRRQRFTEPPPACWIPRLRGDDLIVSSHQAHTRILAMPNASESCKFIVPLLDRGRREGRVLAAPMVRVQQKSTRQNHRYEPRHPAFPARWF